MIPLGFGGAVIVQSDTHTAGSLEETMRARAIRDLAQLSDDDFFREVAGLVLVFQNATHLEDDARLLAEKGRHHGRHVLVTISAEEAAKYLILLDAVVCPRQPAKRFADQLGRFNDHLAKGLYAEACSKRPATFGQLQSYLAHDRVEYYSEIASTIGARARSMWTTLTREMRTHGTRREMSSTPILRSSRIIHPQSSRSSARFMMSAWPTHLRWR